MRRTLIVLLLTLALSATAAAPRRGNERLRELAVFPTIRLRFELGWSFDGGKWVVGQDRDLASEIARARSDLQEQPNSCHLLLQLASLLSQHGHTNEAQAEYERAARLGRVRADQQPRDGPTLTDLGKALAALGKPTEAESLLRKAVLVSSNRWECWIGLGEFLDDQSLRLLSPAASLNPASARAGLASTRRTGHRLTPEAIERSGRLCREASRCFDRAVALAPDNPDAFIARAGFQCLSNWSRLLIQQAQGNGEPDARAERSAIFPKVAIPDLERAEELRPNDYRLVSTVAYFHWINAILREAPGDFTLESLPEPTRRALRKAITRLENLSQESDPATAAGAFEHLGFLRMSFGDSATAASDFRRAVTLDPSRERSWDMLFGVSLESASPQELVRLCESRLQTKDSARNHLLLAKLLAKQGKFDAATTHAKLALKTEPDNLVAHLMLFALAIRQSTDDKPPLGAAKLLNRASKALNAMPPGDEKPGRAREFILNAAIFVALLDQPAEARKILDHFLRDQPDDQTARNIRNALP